MQEKLDQGASLEEDFYVPAVKAIAGSGILGKAAYYAAFPEELTEKAHNYELVPCGSTVLCLDYAQSGVGSQSCGPELMQQYQLNETEFEFVMKLIPQVF